MAEIKKNPAQSLNEKDFGEDIERTKEIYGSLQEKVKILFDDLVRDKLNLELQMIESKKFRLAVDSASDTIIITDPDAIIVYANKATESITGYQVPEILGKKAGGKDLWGNHMNPEFYQKMWETIKVKKEAFRGEINNRRKNGEDYAAELNIAPVLDENGSILFFVSIERDITKEKEMEKMKNEFISLVSHQLRTPLTGIRWFTELLLRNKENNLTPQQLDFLNQISGSNQRMIKLVNDILDISHIETGRKFTVTKANFFLSQAIEEVLTENVSLIQTKSLKITNQVPKTLSIFADYVKIKQVLQNLISNATKYTPAGKAITISVSEKNNKDAIIMVKDEGIGIPAYQKERLFEKFFRADNASSQDPNGSGLGLYIARELIRAHGGEMWFETKENQGTTFYFKLALKGEDEVKNINKEIK
ncbi:MAG TPA: ATP-binding protein [bacterium]|nr:ATP-binding protein [bacterium]HPT30013.1 ATP-binding protein [bacterium]